MDNKLNPIIKSNHPIIPKLKPLPQKKPLPLLSVHDDMVRKVANDLKKRGYIVLADHIGWNDGSPIKINGYIPDIIALDNNDVFGIEIETADSINEIHTISQLRAFSKEKKISTYLIVPYSAKSKAKTMLNTHLFNSVRLGSVNFLSGKIEYNI